jgi:phospholipid transport system substrate-binding protein
MAMSDPHARAARLAAIAFTLVWLPGIASADDATQARAVIEKTVDDVLAILRDPAKNAAQRRSALEDMANDRFDFPTMARLVLARSWKDLKPPQQQEFVEEFRTYLANDYGSRIERYEQEEVEVLGARVEPRGDVTVKTKIVGGENDGALVDYRMRRNSAEWRIIDVVIEGISLVANFRDQFRDVMGREGPVSLIQKLKEKNAVPPPTGA